MAVAKNSMNNENATKVIISICIANYNGHDIIRNCLDSIFQQKTSIPYEVIVHDDASSDDSLEIIRSEYPVATILASDTNVGFCISNNRMVDTAKGKYILLLNNDATLHSDAIETLYNFSELHNYEGVLSLPQYNMSNGELIDRGCQFDPFMNPVHIKGTQTRAGMVAGACLWISKNTWEHLGGFPEWFGSIAEDMFLCCAAWNAGYEVRVLKESGYEHLCGKSFGGGQPNNNRLQTTFKRRSLSERNKAFVLTIFSPPLLLSLWLPIHIASLTLEGLLVMTIKCDGKIWRDIYWFAISSLWKNRRKLNEQRDLQKKIRNCSVFRFLSLFTPIPYKLRMLIKYGMPKIS